MKRAYKTVKRQISGGESKSSSRRNKLHDLKRANSIEVLDACDNDDEREVGMLLSEGHDVNELYLGTTLLNRAVTNNSITLVRILLRHGADVNKTVHGFNPIHKSIIQENHEILKLLLANTNANVDMPVSNGNSPLHLSVDKENIQMIKMLVQVGADATRQNRQGDTPLHNAAKVSNADIFRLLVEHGANLSLINRDGRTALDIASSQKGFEGGQFVQWLS